MDYKKIILLIVIITLMVSSVLTYQFINYKNQVSNVENLYKDQLVTLEKSINDKKNKIKEIQNLIKNKNNKILYGFYYHDKLQKIVYKEYSVNPKNFELDKIINILSKEEDKDLYNSYKTIHIDEYEVVDNTLSLNISINGYNDLTESIRYNIVKSLLWTLYSSTNVETVYLKINKKAVQFVNEKNLKHTIHIYSRYNISPMNDNELYIDNLKQYYFPISFKYNSEYRYIETNLTDSNEEIRVLFESFNKKYNLKLFKFETAYNELNDVYKYTIYIKDPQFVFDPDGKDKEFLRDLKEGFKLVIPQKHTVSFKLLDEHNQEVAFSDGFLEKIFFINYSYRNNPVIK